MSHCPLEIKEDIFPRREEASMLGRSSTDNKVSSSQLSFHILIFSPLPTIHIELPMIMSKCLRIPDQIDEEK